MKRLTVVLFFLLPVLSFGQDQQLPVAIVNSFNKIFPGAVINSWTGNNNYNFTNDWSDDAYFDDFNYDGYPDEYFDDDAYYFDLGDFPFYYNNDLDYNFYVPDDYQFDDQTLPTQYQLDFHYKGLRMSGIFKPDGTFVIAKGRVSVLPGTIVGAVKNAFKGKIIRLEHAKEVIMTPDYLPSSPVYRVKVFVRHNGYYILKINSKGKVISNNRH